METVPFRHVSFAETLEMVEFDPAVHAAPAPMVEYDAALMMAHRAHAAPALTAEFYAALMVAHQAHVAPAPMVEYDAASTVAYRACAALVLVVEYDAPRQTVAHQEHAAPVSAVEYDASAPTVAHQVHVAPAPVDEYDASAARATPSTLVDGPNVKVVHVPQVQVVEKTIEVPQLQTIEEIVDTPEIQTVQSTESLDTAPDLEMAPVERTLRLPLADCEGVIEELSKAMEDGFSAVLDEFIENFDKPEGLSAVIDQHFEKFDKPDKKHESDEYVCGTWASEKGEVEYIASAATGYAGPTSDVKSTSPLQKIGYENNMNFNTSDEAMHDTNYINKNDTNTYTRKLHHR